MAGARREPRGHYFLAGVESDAAFLRTALAAIPGNAYGQLLVEGIDPETMLDWPRPARVSAYRVQHSLGRILEGHLAEPGEPLAEAIRGWAAEWLADADESLPITMWIGGAGNPLVEEVCHELARDHPGIHLHHPEHATAGDR